jgi:hypothetical protein
VKELDPVMLLMSLDYPVDDVDIDRWMIYVSIFWDYLNIRYR